MATIAVAAQKASQSLKGQDVIVYLNASDVENNLPSIIEGQLCSNDSSSLTGTVSFVDYNGNTFKITPIKPDKTFASTSTPGYMASGETITITL